MDNLQKQRMTLFHASYFQGDLSEFSNIIINIYIILTVNINYIAQVV